MDANVKGNGLSEEIHVEAALKKVRALLQEDYGAPREFLAALLIQEDHEACEAVRKKDPEAMLRIQETVSELKARLTRPAEYHLAMRHKARAAHLAGQALGAGRESRPDRSRLDRFLTHPVGGVLVLALILYVGLYRFVGVFGAGTVVDFFEDKVFGQVLNPWLTAFFAEMLPWPMWRDLITGEYGILTLGVRYAVSLILPIVTFFFLFFSVVEDSGYLPRLALLLDRLFKRIGLSGRAVIPMVLGFGCVTMATLVTRTLPGKRERLIATFLLALAVPCSAQWAVILALLAGHPLAMAVWAGVVGAIFLLSGYLASKVLPGQRPSFYMELPPLRRPSLSHVLTKTFVRVKWYFIEIFPLFILASVFIWLGQITGLFQAVVALLEGPTRWIGLPAEAAKIFLFGFFRRDYGAAGLYDLQHQGILDGRQLVVACIALTLFLPCIAQFLVNIKERGWKTGLGLSVFILFVSFGVAFLVNRAVLALGVTL